MTDTQAILADLARATALFQARSIAAAIGAPPPNPEAFSRVDGRVVEVLRFIPHNSPEIG